MEHHFEDQIKAFQQLNLGQQHLDSQVRLASMYTTNAKQPPMPLESMAKVSAAARELLSQVDGLANRLTGYAGSPTSAPKGAPEAGTGMLGEIVLEAENTATTLRQIGHIITQIENRLG